MSRPAKLIDGRLAGIYSHGFSSAKYLCSFKYPALMQQHFVLKQLESDNYSNTLPCIAY
jgi:hypothetical protein